MNEILESLNQVSDAVVAAILNSLWQAAALAAAAWGAMRVWPRMNAATRHLLWWSVLAAVAMLPVVQFAIANHHEQMVAANPPAIEIQNAVMDAAGPVHLPTAAVTPVSPARPRNGSLNPLELHAGFWPMLLAAVWLAAMLLQMARIAWSYRYLRRIKRRAASVSPELRRSFDAWMMSCGIHRPARLLVSNDIVSPMAVGFREPAVILPESLLHQFQECELDHVLLHELAHLARQDDWTNLAARLASAVMVLHPVAAWTLRNIEREREIACDDWVVSMTGAARPYAASLARLFELCFSRRRVMLASGMADRASHLGQRIEMLLHRRRDFAPQASAARVGICTVVLLGCAIVGAQAPRWLAFAQTPAPAPHSSSPMRGSVSATPAPDAVDAPAEAAEPASEAAPAPVAEPASTPEPAATPGPPEQPERARPNSFLAALVAAGYGDLPVDDIISLKSAGVSAQFLNSLHDSGWGKLSAQQLVDLCHRGVSPEYIRQVKNAGIRDLTLQDAMDLKQNGVRPETIEEIHGLGFGPYNAREAIALTHNGLSPDLFRGLKTYGLRNVSLPEVLDAQRAGLNSRDLGEARQYGSNLTLKQIIKLKSAGVF